MAQQVAQGDRLGVGGGNGKVQIFIDIAVQRKLALFDELHDRRPGEQLGDRANTKQSVFGVHRYLRVQVGVAVALGQQQTAILDNRHHRSGDVVLRHLGFQLSIQEGLQLLGIDGPSWLSCGLPQCCLRYGCQCRSWLRCGAKENYPQHPG